MEWTSSPGCESGISPVQGELLILGWVAPRGIVLRCITGLWGAAEESQIVPNVHQKSKLTKIFSFQRILRNFINLKQHVVFIEGYKNRLKGESDQMPETKEWPLAVQSDLFFRRHDAFPSSIYLQSFVASCPSWLVELYRFDCKITDSNGKWTAWEIHGVQFLLSLRWIYWIFK